MYIVWVGPVPFRGASPRAGKSLLARSLTIELSSININVYWYIGTPLRGFVRHETGSNFLIGFNSLRGRIMWQRWLGKQILVGLKALRGRRQKRQGGKRRGARLSFLSFECMEDRTLLSITALTPGVTDGLAGSLSPPSSRTIAIWE